ncbi:MAG: hypothetical protein ACM3X3_00740 [Betaproteobacteria bacterium]
MPVEAFTDYTRKQEPRRFYYVSEPPLREMIRELILVRDMVERASRQAPTVPRNVFETACVERDPATIGAPDDKLPEPSYVATL